MLPAVRYVFMRPMLPVEVPLTFLFHCSLFFNAIIKILNDFIISGRYCHEVPLCSVAFNSIGEGVIRCRQKLLHWAISFRRFGGWPLRQVDWRSAVARPVSTGAPCRPSQGAAETCGVQARVEAPVSPFAFHLHHLSETFLLFPIQVSYNFTLHIHYLHDFDQTFWKLLSNLKGFH